MPTIRNASHPSAVPAPALVPKPRPVYRAHDGSEIRIRFVDVPPVAPPPRQPVYESPFERNLRHADRIREVWAALGYWLRVDVKPAGDASPLRLTSTLGPFGVPRGSGG